MITATGAILYTRHEEKIYVLLAREVKQHKWEKEPKELLNLLGGKIDHADQSVFFAADREFDEETHGFFGHSYLGPIHLQFEASSLS